MKLEIQETELLTERDIKILESLLRDYHRKNPEPQKVHSEQIPRSFLKLSAKDRVHQILLDTDRGFTIRELSETAGISPHYTLVQLKKLTNDKLVEQSANKPYLYYKKGNNVDLKEALKNVPKRVIVG